MREDVTQPFNADVAAGGAYRYTTETHLSCVRANRRFSDVILQNLPATARRIVDVGCGDGTYTAVLAAESGAESVVGIDPADRAVAGARERYHASVPRLTFRTARASELVAAGERFDAAVYRGVIHHVADPAGEIATALRLADTVFFLEPNGWNPVLKILERASAYHREHEERSYGLGRYRDWISEGGGRVESSFFFGLVPMFCPDWFVGFAAGLEPLVERLPLVRRLVCGQVGIRAASPPASART